MKTDTIKFVRRKVFEIIKSDWDCHFIRLMFTWLKPSDSWRNHLGLTDSSFRSLQARSPTSSFSPRYLSDSPVQPLIETQSKTDALA